LSRCWFVHLDAALTFVVPQSGSFNLKLLREAILAAKKFVRREGRLELGDCDISVCNFGLAVLLRPVVLFQETLSSIAFHGFIAGLSVPCVFISAQLGSDLPLPLLPISKTAVCRLDLSQPDSKG